MILTPPCDRQALFKVSAAECVITRSEGFTDQLDVVCEYWGTDIISHSVLSANVVNFHEYIARHPEQAHGESAQTVEGVHWILSGWAAGRELCLLSRSLCSWSSLYQLQVVRQSGVSVRSED